MDGPPQEHPRSENQSTSAYQTGTKDRPIFVDVGHTPRSQQEADQESAKEFRDSATQWGVLGLTGVLAVATVMQFGALLYQGYWLRRSVNVAERALTDLERPYIFVYELSDLKRDNDGRPVISYSAGNYGKSAAVIERVREQMWSGDPMVMFETDEDGPERADHPMLITRVFSADFAKVGIEFSIPTDRINACGPHPEFLYIDARKGEDGNLFYRIVIDYRGPFTAGHSCSYCWRYDFGYGIFILMNDRKVTYSH